VRRNGDDQTSSFVEVMLHVNHALPGNEESSSDPKFLRFAVIIVAEARVESRRLRVFINAAGALR
jgi:hypothetical protein